MQYIIRELCALWRLGDHKVVRIFRSIFTFLGDDCRGFGLHFTLHLGIVLSESSCILEKRRAFFIGFHCVIPGQSTWIQSNYRGFWYEIRQDNLMSTTLHTHRFFETLLLASVIHTLVFRLCDDI